MQIMQTTTKLQYSHLKVLVAFFCQRVYIINKFYIPPSSQASITALSDSMSQ